MKRLLALLLAAVTILCLSLTAFAHSGRTDASGGHKDTKNKSGLGSYHYHCGGHPAHLHSGGGCPYSSGGQAKTPAAPKEVEKITVESPKKVVSEGDVQELSVTTNSSKATSVTWTISDPKIAEVSGNMLTAIGVGTTTVSCISNNGLRASFELTVKEVLVTALVPIPDDSICIGDVKSYSVQSIPSKRTPPQVNWTSSNTQIAAVDSSGKVTAIAEGKAIITAEMNESVFVSFTVTVLPIESDSIAIEYDTTILTDGKMDIKQSLPITVVILPDNTTHKDVTWTISDEAVLKVENNTVIPLQAGTATITAATTNGKTVSLEIKVIKPWSFWGWLKSI